MKQISIFVLGFLGFVMVSASSSVSGQDFTAGKTPAQLFSSDCAECHRSPNGLSRNRDVRTLAGFLREHYTTKSETAGALAAYVSGFAGGTANVRNRGAGVAGPPNAAGERPPADRRRRSEGEATATPEDVRVNASPSHANPLDDSSGRRRRTTNLSGEGEKRRIRNDGEVPRPPGSVATPAPLRSSAAGDATDPISRLRSYLSSGLGSESAIAEAAKTGAPKVRKRRNRADNVDVPAPDVQATATPESNASPTALPSTTIDATAPAGPPEGNAAPAVVPSGPPAVPPQRLEP